VSLAPHDLGAALESMPDQDRADLQAEADAAGLTVELALVAKRLGMTPERYSAFRSVRSVSDAMEVNQRFAERDTARAEARRQLLAEQEKPAIARELLAERERAEAERAATHARLQAEQDQAAREEAKRQEIVDDIERKRQEEAS
jgi:hypothetical protein